MSGKYVPSSGSRTGTAVGGDDASPAADDSDAPTPEAIPVPFPESSPSRPSVRCAAPIAAALATASPSLVTACRRDARKCAAAPAARHAEFDRSAPGAPVAKTGAARPPGFVVVAQSSAAPAAPAAQVHDIEAEVVSVMDNVADGCDVADVSSFSEFSILRLESPPASTTLARSANASAAIAAAVDAASGPLVEVGSSSMGAIRGYKPSTDGVKPPAAAVALHKRSVSIQTPAASRDVSGAPLATAARTARESTPRSPTRFPCSAPDAATRRITRSAAAAVPVGG